LLLLFLFTSESLLLLRMARSMGNAQIEFLSSAIGKEKMQSSPNVSFKSV